MKTPKLNGIKSVKNVSATQKLANAQTKVSRIVSGPSQPVLPGNIEPAVFDIQYLKNFWKKLVKFFE